MLSFSSHELTVPATLAAMPCTSLQKPFSSACPRPMPAYIRPLGSCAIARVEASSPAPNTTAASILVFMTPPGGWCGKLIARFGWKAIRPWGTMHPNGNRDCKSQGLSRCPQRRARDAGRARRRRRRQPVPPAAALQAGAGGLAAGLPGRAARRGGEVLAQERPPRDRRAVRRGLRLGVALLREAAARHERARLDRKSVV